MTKKDNDQFVLLSLNPKTYIKDVKFHTDANCHALRRTLLEYRKTMTLKEAIKTFAQCKICIQEETFYGKTSIKI